MLPLSEPGPITVACYYFPNYHLGDARNEAFHGPGWNEWKLVREARPRFPGHDQPKVPLWGHGDEADPAVMARKIDAAADHGVGAFIFDWYWYDDGPFLERALNEGYLRAPNRDRVKFALMWANHDWVDIHPARRPVEPALLYPGRITAATFDKICEHVIADYFSQPSYWKIDGKPYFSIYELFRLIESFGGIEPTRAALARFEQQARAAGLPGIHFNAVVWGVQILPNEKTVKNPAELIERLGFDSVTSYVWIHHVLVPVQGTDYNEVRDRYFEYFDAAEKTYPVPFFPNVSMGWDSSPRAAQDQEFAHVCYPFMNTIGGNTPERFAGALEMAQERVRRLPGGPRVVTINCWNEWTEGSYLEPDLKTGYAYLEAVRRVFAPAPSPLSNPPG